MRKSLVLLSILMLGIGAGIVSGQAAPKVYDDAEAYAVYSTILKDEWPVRVGKAARLVIRAETGDYPAIGNTKGMCLVPAKGEEAVYGPVLKAFSEANAATWLLQDKFESSIPYEIVSAASIGSIFDKKGVNGWKDFSAKYPNSGGYISMSAVGFNADKTIAIVYMGHSCGGLCGGGTYHVLQKTEGKWAPIKWKGTSCSWAS